MKITVLSIKREKNKINPDLIGINYTISMKLIIGLGNRGEKYKNNRHNAGFIFLDYLVHQYKILNIKNKKNISNNNYFQYDTTLQSEIAKLKINNEKVILVQPATFMNQSGDAVRSCVARYSLNPAYDLFVIHDDLDIRLGEYKIQKGKGPKLHNGVASIEKVLDISNFWRIRIGVDHRSSNSRVAGEAYVLQDFTEEEKAILESIFPKVRQELSRPLVQNHRLRM